MENALKVLTRLWSNDVWKCGFLSGITLSSLVGVVFTCYPYWNSRVSLLLNLVNILDIRTGLLLSKLQYLKEKDLNAINHSRKMQLLLPLGPMRSVESIIKENITSSQGHLIPIQVITPKNYQKNKPIIVYLHGGGFVIGCVDFYLPIMTSLAQYTGCIVIGVDYRKAPEHKFPAAPNDCMESIQWIIQNGGKYGGDTTKICVMGDSAGGNLTAIVAREFSSQISLSIPIYPVVYFGRLSQSKFDNSHQAILPASLMDWFSLRYFNTRHEMSSQFANPLFGDLTKLPRTHIITAEYDPLRDEGREYFQALRDAGVNVTIAHYDNTVHGFYGAEYLVTHGKQSVIDTAEIIKAHFQLT